VRCRLTPGNTLYDLGLSANGRKRFRADVASERQRAMFAEHHSEQFRAALHGSAVLTPAISKFSKRQ
jgi:hypothetical protein